MSKVENLEYHLKQFSKKSIPIVQYARENNLDYEHFRQQLRRYRNALKEKRLYKSSPDKFLPVLIKDKDKGSGSGNGKDKDKDKYISSLEIKINGASVIVDDKFCTDHLKKIITVLKGC